MKLNIYLMDETVKQLESALLSEKLSEEPAYKRLDTRNNLQHQLEAYLQEETVRTPEWVEPIAEYFVIDKNNVKNRSNSLVLLIAVKGRIFAITYGHGYTALNKQKIEFNFGLKVTLNAVDPEKLRSVVSRNMDMSTKQTLVVSNLDSKVREFKFQPDLDMVRMVSGVPINLEIGSRISGSDSVVINTKLDLQDLHKLCQELYELYQSENYKQSFSFIDHVRLVQEEDLRAKLDEDFNAHFESCDSDSILFSNPEISEYEVVDSYELRCNRHIISLIDLDSSLIFAELQSNGYFSKIAQEIKIVALRSDKTCIGKQENLRKFALFETELNGKKYILMLDKWFEVDKDFYDEITRRLSGVKEIKTEGYLPKMPYGMREDKYCSDVVLETSPYVNLDGDFYRGHINSTVEVADLITPNKDLICVKKYKNRSLELSHLFDQAKVSASMFARDNDYRAFVSKQAMASGKISDFPPDINRQKIRYVLAIAFKKEGDVTDLLPFFSKITLLDTLDTLEDLGFRVAVTRIPWEKRSSTDRQTGVDTIG